MRGEAADAEYLMIGYDGVERWVHDRAVPRPVGADGRVLMDGISTDITARREQADRLRAALAELNAAHEALAAAHLETERLARTDTLTGVANRRAFGERAAQETERADRAGEALGIVLLDVDHFKRVNDTYGHDVGDEVLVAVAERLLRRRPVRTTRWRAGAARSSSCWWPRCPTRRRWRASRSPCCASSGEQPIATSAGALRLTASAGTALRPAGSELAAAIDAADNGLYAAKRRGRDRVFAGDTLMERGASVEEHERDPARGGSRERRLDPRGHPAPALRPGGRRREPGRRRGRARSRRRAAVPPGWLAARHRAARAGGGRAAGRRRRDADEAAAAGVPAPLRRSARRSSPGCRRWPIGCRRRAPPPRALRRRRLPGRACAASRSRSRRGSWRWRRRT